MRVPYMASSDVVVIHLNYGEVHITGEQVRPLCPLDRRIAESEIASRRIRARTEPFKSVRTHANARENTRVDLPPKAQHAHSPSSPHLNASCARRTPSPNCFAKTRSFFRCQVSHSSGHAARRRYDRLQLGQFNRIDRQRPPTTSKHLTKYSYWVMHALGAD